MLCDELGVSEAVSALRQRDGVAVCVEELGSSPTIYYTHARGSWWMTTDRHEPRNLSKIGWSEIGVREEIKRSYQAELLPLVETPFGHLVGHHPDTRSTIRRTL